MRMMNRGSGSRERSGKGEANHLTKIGKEAIDIDLFIFAFILIDKINNINYS